MPPTEYRSISKVDLLRKYHDEGWGEKLSQYRLVEWKTGNRKNHKKWFNAENEVMAFILEYQNPGGLVVRELRDGDVHYYVE